MFLIFKNGLDISPLEISQECLHVLHVEGFTLTLSPYNVSSIPLHTRTILGVFFQLLLRFLTGSKLTSSPLKMLLAT